MVLPSVEDTAVGAVGGADAFTVIDTQLVATAEHPPVPTLLT
jgi:hypothetical protein